MSGDISLPSSSVSFKADLSIDFFNGSVNIAGDESANVVNVPVQEQEQLQEPGEWKPQLDSMLNRVEDYEHGGVRNDELNRLLEDHGIRLPENDRIELDRLQKKMAQSMNNLLPLKKSTIMADKWALAECQGWNAKELQTVNDAKDAQLKLANKLRSLGDAYPEIREQLNELADRCDRLKNEMTDMVNSLNPSPRAKEIVHTMGRMPEDLQNLEAELEKCHIDGDRKEAIKQIYQNAKSEWSLLGNPVYALKVARELHDGGLNGETLNFERTCDILNELSQALHDLHKEVDAGLALEKMADDIDRNVVNLINLFRELPEVLELEKDETLQYMRNEASIGQWKPRLDSILKQVSVQEYGNVSMDDINQAIAQLGDVNREELENLQRAMDQSMNALHDLKGTVIQDAYRQEASEIIDDKNKKVIDTVDNAIMSQQSLADKLRAVGKAHPEVQDKLDNLADKCDRRASEILATVNELLNPPRAEEILQELGRSPEALKNLETELDDCRIKSGLKAMVMQKYNAVMEALRNLGARNALELKEELLNGAPNGQLTHFEKAYDALNELSDALHGLRGQRHASEALEKMADAVDRHMMHIINLGNELPELLDAHKNETIKELMIANVPQMHGTQEILAHFSKELSPLMQKLDDFTKAPDKVRDFSELLMISQKLAELKHGLKDLMQNGQIQLRDGTRFLLDTSIIEPLKGLVDKAQTSLDNFKLFFQRNAKTHQLREAIRKSVPLEVPAKLTQSNFWKTYFPALNRVAEFTVRLRQLSKTAESNLPEALDGLEELCQELNGMRRDGNWSSRYTWEMTCLTKLQEAIRQSINGEEIDDATSERLVEELKQNASSEEKTGDMLSMIDVNDFEAFKTGMITEAVEAVNYKMLWLANIFQNVHAQNQLCDEYMKGAMLHRALKENIPLSTLIETRLHNASTEYVDELCDDVNLFDEPEYLGSGQANTVQKCSYRAKDGSVVQKVFKPEYEGRLGNMNLLLGFGVSPTFQNAYLNIASRKMAEAFHSGEIMPKTSVGMLRGAYGIFMDFVEGCVPGKVRNKYGALLNGLSPEEKTKVRGQAMKKCNQLQWIDLAMAQGDRHHENYGLELKKVDGDCQVNLVGFDNDACLPEWKVGLTKINIKGFYLEHFTGVSETRYIGGKRTFLSELEVQGGVIYEADGSITLDTSKMNLNQLKIMHMTTGMQSFKVPDYMDQDIYDGLMELEASPAKFDACLPIDLTAAARGAAKARLREMIELAKSYKAEGKVLDINQWSDPNVQEVMREKNNEMIFNAGGGPGNHNNRLLNDLFFRDLDSQLS